jgi:hypothetical protein
MVGRNVKALSLVPREQRFYDLFEQQATILVSEVARKSTRSATLPAHQRQS